MAGKNTKAVLKENKARANTDMRKATFKANNASVDESRSKLASLKDSDSESATISPGSESETEPEPQASTTKSESSSSSSSSSDSEPDTSTMIKKKQTTSLKVTVAKGKIAKKGHIGQRKVGDPGVALRRTNPKLVNFKSKKDAERLWWEQTDVYSGRWDGPLSNDKGGNDAWATVHLPKVHWKKRKALADAQKKEEEEEEKEKIGGDIGVGDEMEPRKKRRCI